MRERLTIKNYIRLIIIYNTLYLCLIYLFIIIIIIITIIIIIIIIVIVIIIIASFLTDVCRNVSIEPGLQELSGELLTHRSANTTPNARLDVAADGVWGSRFERFFFDVRVFNPFAPSNSHGPLADIYTKHEADKRRLYEERVRDVEQATFIPLIFSTTGGMGKPARSFYRRLAILLIKLLLKLLLLLLVQENIINNE